MFKGSHKTNLAEWLKFCEPISGMMSCIGIGDIEFLGPVQENGESNKNSSRYAPSIGKFLIERIILLLMYYLYVWYTLNMKIWKRKEKMMSQPFLKILIWNVLFTNKNGENQSRTLLASSSCRATVRKTWIKKLGHKHCMLYSKSFFSLSLGML